MALRRYELTDFEWSIIEPLLPNKPRGAPRVDERRVLNGIYWRLRTGSPWSQIPERYGPPTTCDNRFVRWGRRGVWEAVFKAPYQRLTMALSNRRTALRSAFTRRERTQKGGRADRRYRRPGRRSSQRTGAFARRADHQAARRYRCARLADHPAPDRRAGA